eukprot:UN11227
MKGFEATRRLLEAPKTAGDSCDLPSLRSEKCGQPLLTFRQQIMYTLGISSM